jgi:hypothetical protein
MLNVVGLPHAPVISFNGVATRSDTAVQKAQCQLGGWRHMQLPQEWEKQEGFSGAWYEEVVTMLGTLLKF